MKAPLQLPDVKLNCRAGVRKVKSEIRRLRGVDLPADAEQEILRPLKRKVNRLARKCEELADMIQDSGTTLDELLKKLNESTGVVPDVHDPVEDPVDDTLDGVSGNAAGDSVAPAPHESPSLAERVGSWVKEVFSFAGWTS